MAKTSVTQWITFFLFTLSLVCLFATYSPADETHYWAYFATSAVIFGVGYMVDVMFGQDLTFVYDPSPENWRRRTDPQY
jgi:hypothetical protein